MSTDRVNAHHFVRRDLEAIEEATLSPHAAKSARSAGRERLEPESPVRTAFQRDRDRIIHTNAFRRLRAKTQVFISPVGDHYATRLSHALEVAQIARVVARALRLNEDLAEAIALAHDLGHAPFGHAGQEALNRCLGEGYRHDEQSVRVVRYLEKSGRGLNLSLEVIDGIRTHRKPRGSMSGWAVAPSSTLEAEVVRLSDAIAYINHDVDDAVRANIIQLSDLPESAVAVLGNTRSQRINAAVCDIISASKDQPEIRMGNDVLAALDQLREFLFATVYRSPPVLQEAERGTNVVLSLFRYFSESPDALPPEYAADPRGEGAERRIADYIAGMTDSFAIHTFQDLFVPRVWPL